MPTSDPTAQSGIYAIRNTLDGKVYIGSAVNIPRRWDDHRRLLERGEHPNRHLRRAWNKHGADAFVFEVLQVVEDKANLIRGEQEYMDRLESWRQTKGYNISPTAGSTLGRRLSAEHRAKISAGNKGKPATMAGKTHSPESRAKMSIAKGGVGYEPAVWKSRSLSPDEVAKIASEAKTRRPGRTHSPETKAKLAEIGRRRAVATA